MKRTLNATTKKKQKTTKKETKKNIPKPNEQDGKHFLQKVAATLATTGCNSR